MSDLIRDAWVLYGVIVPAGIALVLGIGMVQDWREDRRRRRIVERILGDAIGVPGEETNA